VINMTQYPEVALARELGMCYVNIALITDYDAGLEGESGIQPVSVDEVVRVLHDNNERVRQLIERLLPRLGGGRVAAVEVMVNNARVADLVRENRAEEIPDAIAEGAFFQMQTFTDALIELVLAGDVEREVAADAATNRHDFLVALKHALKRQAAGVTKEEERRPQAAPPEEEEEIPALRLADPLQG
jgi:hypothetical protein